MSKIITTTFLLKNPAKVREMVNKGQTVLVKHNDKIVMKITLPDQDVNKPKKPKPITSGKVDYEFNREEIYNQRYD